MKQFHDYCLVDFMNTAFPNKHTLCHQQALNHQVQGIGQEKGGDEEV